MQIDSERNVTERFFNERAIQSERAERNVHERCKPCVFLCGVPGPLHYGSVLGLPWRMTGVREREMRRGSRRCWIWSEAWLIRVRLKDGEMSQEGTRGRGWRTWW